MGEEMLQKVYGKQAYHSFLNKRNKPHKSEDKTIVLPDKMKQESDVEYQKRVFKKTGVRLTMTGPLKMPKPNNSCPCGKKYDDGTPVKFKKCCGLEEHLHRI